MPPTTATTSGIPGRLPRAERTLESIERDDLRRAGTRWINRHPDIPQGAKIVWQCIAEMTLGYRKEEDYLSHAVIADLSGLQSRAVSRAVHSLEAVGAITYRQGYTDPATGRMVPSWVRVLRPWEGAEDEPPVSPDGGTYNVVPLHPSVPTGATPVRPDTRRDTRVTLPPSDETPTPRLDRRDPPVSTDGTPPSVETGDPPSELTGFPRVVPRGFHEDVHEDAHEGGAAPPRRARASATNRHLPDAGQTTTPPPVPSSHDAEGQAPVDHLALQASARSIEKAETPMTADTLVMAFLDGAARASRSSTDVPPVLPPMGHDGLVAGKEIAQALAQGATGAHVAVALAASMIREKGSERHDGWKSVRWLLDRLSDPRVTVAVRDVGGEVGSLSGAEAVARAAEVSLARFGRERAGGSSSWADRAREAERVRREWLGKE